MAKEKGLSLPTKKERKAPVKEKAKESKAKSKSKEVVEVEEDDEDEDLFEDLDVGGGSRGKYLTIILCVFVVVLIAALFLVLMGGRGKSSEYEVPDTVVNEQVSDTQSSTAPQSIQENNLGTQDFTGNTNMSNSDVMTNPDMYVEDLYGLTTRVDYTVKNISSVADFVSYTKHRGTWGGGLELYWLDVNYKDRKYVVQVPFQYYKELDEIGIVPVKMEVLTVEGSANGDVLTVISYMSLDEATLKEVLKSQSK